MSVYDHIAYPHKTWKPDPIYLKFHCLSLRASQSHKPNTNEPQLDQGTLEWTQLNQNPVA